jgi:hypothetical protein
MPTVSERHQAGTIAGRWRPYGKSRRDALRTSGSADAPAAERMDFPFPPSPALEQFDQIKVIFRRPLAYAAHSARVSIERFS